MDFGIRHKTAIVTGAGRGIGRAVALTLAREGVNVAVDDIELGVAASVADEARALGARAIPAQADVGDVGQVKRMLATATENLGDVDILVNVAGARYVEGAPKTRSLFRDATPEDYEAEIRLILLGT